MKLTMREFRANLRKYLDLMKEGEVFEVGGVTLCMYKEEGPDLNKLEKKLDEVYELIKEQGKFSVQGNYKGGVPISPSAPIIQTKEVFQEMYEGQGIDERFPPCALCSKKRQLYTVYQDGEREVCEPCIRRTMGKRANSFMATAQKVEIQEDVVKAPPVSMKPQTGFNDDPVTYCSKCRFRAVWNGKKICNKCSSKKKKK